LTHVGGLVTEEILTSLLKLGSGRPSPKRHFVGSIIAWTRINYDYAYAGHRALILSYEDFCLAFRCRHSYIASPLYTLFMLPTQLMVSILFKSRYVSMVFFHNQSQMKESSVKRSMDGGLVMKNAFKTFSRKQF
jgi:hypothetical protein